MRIAGHLHAGRSFFVRGKAQPLEHWHAEVTLLGKIAQDGLRSSGITTGVKDYGGIDPKAKRSSIRPGNGRHLLARIAAGIAIKQCALLGWNYRKVPCFVQEIAGKK